MFTNNKKIVKNINNVFVCLLSSSKFIDFKVPPEYAFPKHTMHTQFTLEPSSCFKILA